MPDVCYCCEYSC